MNRVKNFFSNAKSKVALAVTTVTVGVMSVMPVSAAESVDKSAITTALETGLSNTVTDILGYLAIALGVGLTAFGAFFGIKKVIGFFRTIAK